MKTLSVEIVINNKYFVGKLRHIGQIVSEVDLFISHPYYSPNNRLAVMGKTLICFNELVNYCNGECEECQYRFMCFTEK